MIDGVPKTSFGRLGEQPWCDVYPVILYFKERDFDNDVQLRRYDARIAVPELQNNNHILRPGLGFKAEVHERLPYHSHARFKGYGFDPGFLFVAAKFEITSLAKLTPPVPDPAAEPLAYRLRKAWARRKGPGKWFGPAG